MNLIFIYGPPASGKLTIAEKLSEHTNIPVFHNHLSRDLVKDIYQDDLKDNYELVDTIREDVLEYCAKKGTDLIFTFVYDGPEGDDNVKNLINAVERNGGKVKFVELMADKQSLLERVGNESRKKYQKLTDADIMDSLTQDMSIYSIPFVEPLKVNTSELSPEEAARFIIHELQLGHGV